MPNNFTELNIQLDDILAKKNDIYKRAANLLASTLIKKKNDRKLDVEKDLRGICNKLSSSPEEVSSVLMYTIMELLKAGNYADPRPTKQRHNYDDDDDDDDFDVSDFLRGTRLS